MKQAGESDLSVERRELEEGEERVVERAVVAMLEDFTDDFEGKAPGEGSDEVGGSRIHIRGLKQREDGGRQRGGRKERGVSFTACRFRRSRADPFLSSPPNSHSILGR